MREHLGKLYLDGQVRGFFPPLAPLSSPPRGRRLSGPVVAPGSPFLLQVYPINDSSTFVETDSADSHLGRGCFGVVRRITHRATGRVLAVKVASALAAPRARGSPLPPHLSRVPPLLLPNSSCATP